MILTEFTLKTTNGHIPASEVIKFGEMLKQAFPRDSECYLVYASEEGLRIKVEEEH